VPTRKIPPFARKTLLWAFWGFMVLMLFAIGLDRLGNIEINPSGYGKLTWVVWLFNVGVGVSVFRAWRDEGMKAAIFLGVSAAMLVAAALFRGLPIASTYVYATPQSKTYYAYGVIRKKPSSRARTRFFQDAMGTGGTWYKVVVHRRRVDASGVGGLFGDSSYLFVRDPKELPAIGVGTYWMDPKPIEVHGLENWFVFRMRSFDVVNQ